MLSFSSGVCHNQELRGEVWQFDGPLMVYLNDRLIGDEKELARWAHELWGFTLHRPHALNLALAEDYYSSHLRDTGASLTHTRRTQP